MDKTFSDIEREEGIEGVVNRWVYGDFNDRQRALEYVQSKTGFSEAELWKANNGVFTFCSALSNKKDLLNNRLLQTAKLIHNISNGFYEELDIDSWLREYAVRGYDMNNKRVNDFSLRPLHTRGLYGRTYAVKYGDEPVEVETGVFKIFNFFLDAPAAIALFHNDEPKAVVSFFPEDENTLQIKQIQGARIITEKKEKRNELVPQIRSHGGGCLGTLDWKRFLVSCAEQVGKDLGYSTVSIQGARNNKWVLDGALPLEKGVQIYDETAERLGYAQVGIGNWYKTIKND